MAHHVCASACSRVAYAAQVRIVFADSMGSVNSRSRQLIAANSARLTMIFEQVPASDLEVN